MKLTKHNLFAALRCIRPLRRVLGATLVLLSVVIALAAFGLRPGANSYVEEDDTAQAALRPDQPDEAIRFRNLQLQDENGRIPVDGLLKGKAQMEVMKEALRRRAAAAGDGKGLAVANIMPNDWVSVGPGNIGGRIRALVIHPTNADKIWIGSPSGGIWSTTNGGTSWYPVDDFMANLAVSTMVIDPTNPNVLYAGTGESFPVKGFQGLGVFKSTDGGVTWNQLASTNPAITPPPPGCGNGSVPCPDFWFYVNRLAISPDGATILAATGKGIARSTDGGASWTQRGFALTQDIDFRPGDSTQAVRGLLGEARYSTDGGVTWVAATFNPAITAGSTNATNGRVELAYAGNGNPQTVFASVNNNDGDLYRSMNGGQTYTRVNTGTNFFRDATPGSSNQGWYDNALWVDPVDANTVIVGGIDLWRSANGGATFAKISQWQCAAGQHVSSCAGPSAHADHHIIVEAPGFNNTTNRRVYFGNDGGILRTDDVLGVGPTNGWVSLNNNLAITQFYSGATTPDLVLIGGTQDNGNLRNPPDASYTPFYNPQAWDTPVGAEGDGGFVAVDPTDPAYVYVEYPSLRVSRSSDGGVNFANISVGITDAASANFVAPFVLDPNNADRMLAGAHRLWRSNNVKSASAPTWNSIKDPVSDGATPPSNVPISAIVVAQSNSDLAVVGHNGGEIFLTSNATAAVPAWAKIDAAAMPKRLVTRLVIDTTRSPNWIYATFGGFSPDNVYVTKDLGATWSDITGSGATALPDIPVRTLVLSPVQPDFIYVGTELGLFASEDGGATWQLPQGGPANVSVEDVFWTGGYFTAVTYGRGFYVTNGRGFFQSGGGSCLYPPAPCSPNNTCTPGWWDCPCTWGGPNSPIPGPNDDAVVSCPVLVRGNSVSPRNLRVNSHLTFAPTASLSMPSGNLFNYGAIDGGAELRTNHLFNAGTISTGKLRIFGDLTSGGVISTSGGWDFSGGDEYPVYANNITLTNSGSLIATGVWCKGSLLIGPDASLHALSSSTQSPAREALYLYGNATNLGFLDVRGEFALSIGTGGGNAPHTFWGEGQWKVGAFTVGDRYDPRFGGYSTLTLAGDVTIEVTGLPAFPNRSMVISAQATIKQNGFNLTLNASSLWNYGQIDLGFGALNLSSPSIKLGETTGSGRNNSLGPPGFVGTGSVNLSLDGNIYLEAFLPTWQPSFKLLAGTVDLRSGTTVSGTFTIDAGATVNLNTGILNLPGNATINGTVGKSSGFTGGNLAFTGATLTNNGSISVGTLTFNYGANAVPRNITIAGPGAWPGANLVRVGFPNAATNLTLANDMTVNWTQLSIYGGSTIQTGAFTLTMPCSTTFDLSSPQFINGEIFGTVRRTNLGDCNGTAIPFTSGFTTVRFDAGTPPSEMTISNKLASPPGFPSAVLRDYRITPVGGSGYSATLRLDYSPADTNGNPTGTLALWRNNGTNWISQGATARDLSAHWVELSGVTQFSPWALASCALSISPGSTSIAAGGGMGSFQVNSTGTCSWTATSNAAWITVTSGASGSTDGTVGFTAAANTGAQRSGMITVAGAAGTTQIFSVSQAADCSGLTLNPTSADVDSYGGSGSIAVSATNGCGWTASSNAPWIIVTSGSSGSGNGTVGYSVQFNSGPARSGTITVSGQTFTLNQASGCYSYFDASGRGVAAAGGNFATYIYTPGECPWEVVSNASWITITPPLSGVGENTLSYAVAANPGPPRVGTFSMADQTFTVTQGSNAPLALAVTSTDDAGAGSFRQALLDANANVGQTNTISFNLSGPVTIAPTQPLPSITNPVVINGINHDGRRVVLDGSVGGGERADGGGGLYYGLVLAGGDTTIRGLSIVRFYGAAINLSSNGNTIENCYLGTDPAGAPGLGNGTGIEIYYSNNRIGGTAPGTGNVIASGSYGLAVAGDGNVIQNNYIGTNAAGLSLGNSAIGVLIYGSDNTIGGTAPQTANTIAFNGDGVTVAGVNNRIRGNSIFENTGLGLDLVGDGVTLNDPCDSDTGANNLQNFPALSAASSSGSSTSVQGTLEGTASTQFIIEFFANTSCDPSGNGEGKTFLGAKTVTTDATCQASFSFNDLPGATGFLTATATDPAGNTSEFSGCVQIAAAPVPQSVVSRKVHGSAGAFDIVLPLAEPAAVECRSGGATGDHQIVVTFGTAVTMSGNPQAGITIGTADIGTAGVPNGGVVSVAGGVVTIPLTNVANAQAIVVTLYGVSDGTNTGDLAIPMGVLLGDTNGNKTVSASDVSQTKAQAGMTVTNANFRQDVTPNGTINASDIGLVKSTAGTQLP